MREARLAERDLIDVFYALTRPSRQSAGSSRQWRVET
jgi:hypothetical protein